MPEKQVYSFWNNKGKLYVDCAECKKGGNGLDTDKCLSGWEIKRGGKLGCFRGTLISGIVAVKRLT